MVCFSLLPFMLQVTNNHYPVYCCLKALLFSFLCFHVLSGRAQISIVD